MNYYIITGTSRGLGEALTRRLMSKDNYLFCISRKKNESLIAEAEKKNCKINYLEYDLENIDGLDELLEGIFNKVDRSKANSICLINNAGVLTPIKPIGKCESSEITSNIKVNAIAPMILTSGFIRLTENLGCARKIMNISSGAGINPYYGWGSYCSSKAAVDMYTRCIGMEQKGSNPVKIVAFYPGIIDTEMQGEIRRTSAEDFELVKEFIRYKESGELRDPDYVAQKVIEVMNDCEVKTGSIVHIKERI